MALYILYFFFYSSLGWLIESIYCSAAAKRWINRGFLTGPLCPIYGTGALVMAVILGPLKALDLYLPMAGFSLKITPVLVVLAGMVLCDIVEFITSLLMEKLFHARWWDYSDKPYNIQGRICLGHTMYWGIAAIGFLYLVHPIVEGLFRFLPQRAVSLLLVAVLAIFALDLVNAVRAALDVKDLMDKMRGFTKKLRGYSVGFRSSVTGSYHEVRQFVNHSSLHLSRWAGGSYRRKKGETARLPFYIRVKRSRVGRLFFGYPTLRRDAEDSLAELNMVLNEIEYRLFGEDNREMY